MFGNGGRSPFLAARHGGPLGNLYTGSGLLVASRAATGSFEQNPMGWFTETSQVVVANLKAAAVLYTTWPKKRDWSPVGVKSDSVFMRTNACIAQTN